MLQLFFQIDLYHYAMVKCRLNVDFEEMDTERSIEKDDGF